MAARKFQIISTSHILLLDSTVLVSTARGHLSLSISNVLFSRIGANLDKNFHFNYWNWYIEFHGELTFFSSNL